MFAYLQKNLSKVFFWLMYLGDPPWDTGVTPPELTAFIESHEPGRALDVGCGTGTNVITLAKHGWQVIGVDFVQRAIRTARRKIRRARVNADVHVGDATKLTGIEGPFDLILDIGCAHILKGERQRAYLENVQRLLAPGGTYLTYAHQPVEPDEGHGLSEADIENYAAALNLVKRVDSSEGSGRPSVWMWFEQKKDA
ncbi:MAG: class I SAM-dependent methyltransferase [Anaerolineales bacterium]|nr:class I SAM-dependent methyltransferase [Anaerolineales bacterium]